MILISRKKNICWKTCLHVYNESINKNWSNIKTLAVRLWFVNYNCWCIHASHSLQIRQMWAPALTGRKHLCWMLWKPLSRLRSACWWEKRSWATSMQQRNKVIISGFSQWRSTPSHDRHLSLISTSILRKIFFFTCPLHKHFVVKGSCELDGWMWIPLLWVSWDTGSPEEQNRFPENI